MLNKIIVYFVFRVLWHIILGGILIEILRELPPHNFGGILFEIWRELPPHNIIGADFCKIRRELPPQNFGVDSF